MRKRRTIALVLSLAMLMVFAATGIGNAGESQNRIYGKDRYATSLAVAQELRTLRGEKFQSIILASGAQYADALSGSSLASVTGAPVILAKTGDENLTNFLNDNLAEDGTIYLLGGEAVLPEEVLVGVTAPHQTKRLAGANRYETNLAILEEVEAINGAPSGLVLICSGDNYPDALSAAATGYPILLATKTLTAEQKAYLSGFQDKLIYLIGGEGAVSKEVEDAAAIYAEPERVSGINRYETSVAIAERFFPGVDGAVVAYGGSFADGLSGSALAYQQGYPILLSANNAAGVVFNFMYDMGIPARNMTILGGPTLIDDAALSHGDEPAGWFDIQGNKYYMETSGKMTKEPFTISGYKITPHSSTGYIPTATYNELLRRQSLSSYGTCIVVDIKTQTVDYVKDGVVVFSSPVVTGAYGYTDTPTGTYYINRKSRGATLEGATYSNYVNYWMPYYKSLIGFHDATWRSEFGGEIYKSNGSHGCVNMPLNKIEELFNMVEVGTKVIVK